MEVQHRWARWRCGTGGAAVEAAPRISMSSSLIDESFRSSRSACSIASSSSAPFPFDSGFAGSVAGCAAAAASPANPSAPSPSAPAPSLSSSVRPQCPLTPAAARRRPPLYGCLAGTPSGGAGAFFPSGAPLLPGGAFSAFCSCCICSMTATLRDVDACVASVARPFSAREGGGVSWAIGLGTPMKWSSVRSWRSRGSNSWSGSPPSTSCRSSSAFSAPIILLTCRSADESSGTAILRREVSSCTDLSACCSKPLCVSFSYVVKLGGSVPCRKPSQNCSRAVARSICAESDWNSVWNLSLEASSSCATWMPCAHRSRTVSTAIRQPVSERPEPLSIKSAVPDISDAICRCLYALSSRWEKAPRARYALATRATASIPRAVFSASMYDVLSAFTAAVWALAFRPRMRA